MLRANAQNMAADVLISFAVLCGLGLTFYFKIGMIDCIAALLVGFWVIKASIGIFLEANNELMDGGTAAAEYKKVFEAVLRVRGAGNPHRTRIRRIGGYLDITLDIEVDSSLTVCEAHSIANKVEAEIRQSLDAVYDIIVHIEPAGDSGNEKNEGYGLKPGILEGEV